MADYKADQFSGYQRSSGGTFTNPIDGTPTLTFNEEHKVTIGDETFTRPCGALTVAFADPATPITLLNPANDAVIGNATYQDLFVLLYSLYRQAAAARDAGQEA